MEWVDQWAADGESARRRIEARQNWVRGRIEALRHAQAKADAAWMRLDDPETDEPPPEQERVDAIWEELDDVQEHDRWPRALHWGGI